MADEGLETQELKEKLEEAAERAEGGEGSAPWTKWLSLSTAVIAVLAAIASLEAGGWANEAIVAKNDAVLHQSKAGDAWAHYQAAGVKAVIYETQGESAVLPELSKKWKREAEREKTGQAEIKAEAESEQELVNVRGENSQHSLHVHHQFAKSVTVFQVSIALAAIGALTRRKAMWWVSLVVGATGAAFFLLGFLHA